MAERIDLAGVLAHLPARRGRFPWRNHEYVRGWGVFGLPFDTGHVLALRVFPDNDFAPYQTVWHRNPDGAWSIFVDGPRADTACPRYYGPACRHIRPARIHVQWTGPTSLRVAMPSPLLEWNLRVSETRLLRAVNAISSRLPLWTWKPDVLVHARGLIASTLLGMGTIRLRGTMPSGHHGTLMPLRMYFIESSTALLEGVDLGNAARLDAPPSIGTVTLPARGVLAIGQAAWEILDPGEYERTRRETARGYSHFAIRRGTGLSSMESADSGRGATSRRPARGSAS